VPGGRAGDFVFAPARGIDMPRAFNKYINQIMQKNQNYTMN
jgi:hypothetical protein